MIPITVIAGPTASGKTALAVAWAERTGAEIVSADSQQVYRRFDIGTGKPSPEERARAVHHLISVVDPTDAFSAARYQQLADAAIADIHARGRPVLVVGGTGLYLRVLLRGVMPGPEADPAWRAKLAAEAQALGWPALHRRLAEVDPDSARTIAAADPVRITRALEIYAKTGGTASQARRAHGFAAQRYDARYLVLDPPRAELYAAIEARVGRMFDGGLLEEVGALAAEGLAETAPMRSVGYAQALRVVRGEWTPQQARAEVVQATRRYAKRQGTWFRKEPGVERAEPPFERLLPR